MFATKKQDIYISGGSTKAEDRYTISFLIQKSHRNGRSIEKYRQCSTM